MMISRGREEKMRKGEVLFITKKRGRIKRGIYFHLFTFLAWCVQNRIPTTFESEVGKGYLDLGTWAAKIMPQLSDEQKRKVFDLAESKFRCYIDWKIVIAT